MKALPTLFTITLFVITYILGMIVEKQRCISKYEYYFSVDTTNTSYLYNRYDICVGTFNLDSNSQLNEVIIKDNY